MKLLKLMSGLALFLMLSSSFTAGFGNPVTPDTMVNLQQISLSSGDLVTRQMTPQANVQQMGSLTKLSPILQSWMKTGLSTEIHKISGKYSVMMFVAGDDPTLGGLITPLGSFKFGDTGVTWVHTTISSRAEIYSLSTYPSVLRIAADKEADNPVLNHKMTQPQDYLDFKPTYPLGTSRYEYDQSSKSSLTLDGKEIIHYTRDITGVDYVNETFGYNGTGTTVNIVDSGVDFGRTTLRGTLATDSQGRSASFDNIGYRFAFTQLYSQELYTKLGQPDKAAKFAPLHVDSEGYIHTSKVRGMQIWDQYYEIQAPSDNFIQPWIPEIPIPDKYFVGNIPGNQTGFAFGMVNVLDIGLPELVPFILADSNNDGDYDTLYIDYETVPLATQFYIGQITASDYLSQGQFNISDDIPNTNTGNQYLAADLNGDRFNDVSLGALANAIDYNNITGYMTPTNTPIFRGIEPSGVLFSHFTSYYSDHGTGVANNLAGQPITLKFSDGAYTSISGIAPGAKILATHYTDSLEGSVSIIYGTLWAAGYEPVSGTQWGFVNDHVANFSTNSWGYSTITNGGYAAGADWISIFYDYLSPEGYLDPNAPGMLYLFASGNAGQGYGGTGSVVPHTGMYVGASTSFQWVNEQIPFWGTNLVNTHANDELADFSSSGPTPQAYPKIDIVNVGLFDWNIGGIHPLQASNSFGWWAGTSLACPNTAGLMAILFQAYEAKHGSMVNHDLAKVIMKSTAVDLGYDAYRQGSGRADIKRAVYYILDGSLPGGEELLSADTPDSLRLLGERLDNAFAYHFGAGVNSGTGYANFDGVGNPLLDNSIRDSAAYGGTILPGESQTLTFNVSGTVSASQAFYYGTSHTEVSDLVTQTGHVMNNSLYDLFDSAALDDAYTANVMVSFSDASIQPRLSKNAAPSIEIIIHDDINNDGIIQNNEVHLYNLGGSSFNMDSMTLGPRLLNKNTKILIFDSVYDDPKMPDLEYKFSIRTFKKMADSEVSITDIGSNQVNVTMAPSANAVAGYYQGFLEFNATNGGRTIVPYSYSVALTVGDYNTDGFSEVNKLVNRSYDNGFIGSVDYSWRFTTGDWRYYDLQLQGASSANTLALDISTKYEGTVFDVYVVDEDGALVMTSDINYVGAGRFASKPNSPPTSQRLLVNLTDYQLGDTFSGGDLSGSYDQFTVILHAVQQSSDAIPLDPITLRATWVSETVSQFDYPIPSLITTGSDTYDGFPVTSKDIGVQWSAVTNNPIPEFNTSSADMTINVGSFVQKEVDDTIPVSQLKAYTTQMFPERTYEVDLVKGMKATVLLDWEQASTDFDFILIPKGAPYAFDSDVFGGQSATGGRPEQASGIIPATGTYELVVEWFSGNAVPQTFHLEFFASINVASVKVEDTVSHSIDLVAMDLANAKYNIESVITGWNFPNIFSQQFYFDSGGPSVIYTAAVDESVSGNIVIGQVNDAVPYEYTLSKGTTTLQSGTDVKGPKDLVIDAALIEGVLQDNVFVLTGKDALGKTSSHTLTIHRKDQSGPEFLEKPDSELTIPAGVDYTLKYKVKDYKDGTYSVVANGFDLTSGSYKSEEEVDIVINLQKGSYTVRVEFTDAGGFSSADILKISVTDSSSTTQKKTTSSNEKSPFAPLFLIVLSAAFVAIVRTRKYNL